MVNRRRHIALLLSILLAFCTLALSGCADVMTASESETKPTPLQEYTTHTAEVYTTDSQETTTPKQNKTAKETESPKQTKKPAATDDSNGGTKAKQLRSYYLDVGQGDSEFIELPNGECMLIDAGDRGYSDLILGHIKGLGYDKIDYVIVTHPHADHIGSMEDVVESMKIGKVYMPHTDCDTKTYEALLNAIADKGLKIKTAKAGVSILSDGNLSIDIVAPVYSYDDLNNASAVIMLTYGKTRFLYMGDAETQSENDITTDVSCNVIKVGHHGSDTSSGAEFVRRTGADYAIISVGEGNSYGHPVQSVIRAWEKQNAEVFRTDKNGTILVKSDGESISVSKKTGAVSSTPTANPTERATPKETEGAEYSWVLNTSTHKIHKPTCRYVGSIDGKNRSYSQKSIEKLMSEGYTCCKVCKPH